MLLWHSYSLFEKKSGFFFSFQVVSDAMLAELKQCFMEAYDDNQDGKIDIREVKFHAWLFWYCSKYLKRINYVWFR